MKNIKNIDFDFTRTSFLIAFVCFGIGFGLGYYLGGGADALILRQENAQLRSQIDKAKSFFPSVAEVRSLPGTVKSISEQIVTIDVSAPPNPFEEWPQEREVIVTQNTKIVKDEAKKPDVFQKEMEVYQKSMADFQARIKEGGVIAAPPVPPTPIVETTSTIQGIKPGDKITVYASEDVKNQISFEAVRIVVMPTAALGFPSDTPSAYDMPLESPLPASPPAPAPLPPSAF